jgi:hypothetical protein
MNDLPDALSFACRGLVERSWQQGHHPGVFLDDQTTVLMRMPYWERLQPCCKQWPSEIGAMMQAQAPKKTITEVCYRELGDKGECHSNATEWKTRW